MNIMSGKDIFNQKYSLHSSFWAHQFGKIQLCTKKIPNRPQPLLKYDVKKRGGENYEYLNLFQNQLQLKTEKKKEVLTGPWW